MTHQTPTAQPPTSYVEHRQFKRLFSSKTRVAELDAECDAVALAFTKQSVRDTAQLEWATKRKKNLKLVICNHRAEQAQSRVAAAERRAQDAEVQSLSRVHTAERAAREAAESRECAGEQRSELHEQYGRAELHEQQGCRVKLHEG